MNYVEYEYLFLLNDNWKSLEFLDSFLSTCEYKCLASANPEEIIIRKDLLNSLSDQAKEVVELILISSGEVLDIILSKRKTFISKGRLKDFLVHEKGWAYKEVDLVFEELHLYIKDLEEIF